MLGIIFSLMLGMTAALGGAATPEFVSVPEINYLAGNGWTVWVHAQIPIYAKGGCDFIVANDDESLTIVTYAASNYDYNESAMFASGQVELTAYDREGKEIASDANQVKNFCMPMATDFPDEGKGARLLELLKKWE